MSTYATAAEAVKMSQEHSEITWARDTEDNREYLRTQCDGCIPVKGDYWQADRKDQDGYIWRVRVGNEE